MGFERLAESANCVPEEVVLLNEIARLQAAIQSTCDPARRDAAAARLRDQQMRLEILKELRRTSAQR